MAHGHGGQRPGAGRKHGSRNKRTLEAEQAARAIVEDPAVQALWLHQARAGTLAAPILQTLMFYAWGRPVERVQHSGDVDKPLVLVLRRTGEATEPIARVRRIGTDRTAPP